MFSASGKGTWSGFLTYDMLHGGGHRHWEVINRIATEYELGKNQSGHGSFTGKDVRLQDDGSIMIMLLIRLRLRIKLGRARGQQRYSRCTPSEIEQLTGQQGGKGDQTLPGSQGGLLQQSFPVPRVADILEGNKIAEEVHRHARTGTRVMPIPWRRLRAA